MIIYFIVVYIYSFIVGTLISFYSSYSNCENTDLKKSLKKGLKVGFLSLLVYIIIIYVPFFKSGFISLYGKNDFLGNSSTEAILLVLSNIAITIDNYFKSIIDSCKLDFDESARAYSRIEKRLNDRKPKEKPEKVEIKG